MIALALILGPNRIANGWAPRGGDQSAVSSVPEESCRAEAAVVPKLSSSAGDADFAVPEGTQGADALREGVVPDLAVGARRKGNAGLAVEVGAIGALIADGQALPCSPVHGGGALARDREAVGSFSIVP